MGNFMRDIKKDQIKCRQIGLCPSHRVSRFLVAAFLHPVQQKNIKYGACGCGTEQIGQGLVEGLPVRLLNQNKDGQ
jgi:hypothetical protein